MNCLEVQASFSAAHDGDVVSAADLVAARAHCDECAECTAFVDGLRQLDAMPVPPTPVGLIDRILAAVEPLQAQRALDLALRAEQDSAEGLGTELPVPEEEPIEDEWVPDAPLILPATTVFSRFEWFQGPTKWASFGALGALAATALIAFVISGSGAPARDTRTATTADASGVAPESSLPGAAQKAGSAPLDSGPAPTAAPAQAPDYVLYKEYVYRPGALLADSSSATPSIGTLTTSFASGSAQSATVYRSPVTDGSIVVKGPDGLRVYAPVVRMLTSVRYQLTSGSPIERFGVWPTLPTRFPLPSSPEGTPTFVTAGSDSENVRIFAATGRPVSEGFAVAPGTGTSDPAGGNPNWTWWAPAPVTP